MHRQFHISIDPKFRHDIQHATPALRVPITMLPRTGRILRLAFLSLLPTDTGLLQVLHSGFYVDVGIATSLLAFLLQRLIYYLATKLMLPCYW